MNIIGGLVGALLLLGTCGSASSAGIHARMAYSEEQGLRVVDVPPGPSADQGLVVGDRIIAIDGETVHGLVLQEIVERLRGRPGSFVEIDVARDGEVTSLRVERKRYARETGT